MNPVLVKPEGDDRSQVIVLGRPDHELSRLPWRGRHARLWPVIAEALRSLQAEHELVLLEGAGSPAEINLRDTDLANMRSAEAADAAVVLVADIDRGGAFAHLYGTWALLRASERRRLAGFVLNKFRGDARLLPPGPQRLEQLTRVPTLGVLPWLEHELPDEDGAARPRPAPGKPRVAVVRYPTASNLDELKPLEQVADVRFAARVEDLVGAALVVLPGSKHVSADLAWLRRSGLARAVAARAGRGEPVLGICGGLQMLGARIVDEAGVDGSGDGLGLLPLVTCFRAEKATRHTRTRFCVLPPPWTALSARPFVGYEIRHGETTAIAPVAEALPDGLGYVAGSVCGIYLHGLFEQPELVAALFSALPARSLEQVFDRLADAVEEHLDLVPALRQVGLA